MTNADLRTIKFLPEGTVRSLLGVSRFEWRQILSAGVVNQVRTDAGRHGRVLTDIDSLERANTTLAELRAKAKRKAKAEG